MFRYQKLKSFFGQIPEDYKDLGVRELKKLGAESIEAGYGGVYFSAGRNKLYEIVYQSRLFSRFLAPLHRFDCHHDNILYDKAKDMDWEKILNPDKTFAIYANVGNSKISHSQFAARRLKDAIADYFMDRCGRRPSVDTENPDVLLNLFINKNKAVINLDLSGGAAHKRGYRVSQVEAPMKETLAAAIIEHTGWDGECPLFDPMCGSGTLLIEAMMMYCKIPALYKREKFGFMSLPDYSEHHWHEVKRKCDDEMRPLPQGLIGGGDLNIDAALDNTEQLPFGDRIEFVKSDFRELKNLEKYTIVSNPPYGVRLDTGDDPGLFMKDIGDFLKQKCTGSDAWIYIGSTALMKRIGLRTSKRIILNNGGLDGRLAHFEMYRGTKDP
ncbi:MAG: THUMP domain-containing protein [Lentisphaeraceae bacterium]|nr:THUMP domain-containing protein [Lentisphaeraceae bacterium]